MVRLLFKVLPSLLRCSQSRVQACLQKMLKKLSQNEELCKLYFDFMKEYSDRNHVKKVPIEELIKKLCFTYLTMEY